LLLVLFFFASSVSAEAKREIGARPFFSEISSQAIDLYNAYPEIPTTEVLDERISPDVYNDVSSPGLMVRSLSLWATNMKYSGIIGDQGVCSSLLDSKCSNSKSLSLVADYLPCMNSKQTDCISRFAVESSPGVWEDAEPISPIFGGDLFVDLTITTHQVVRHTFGSFQPISIAVALSSCLSCKLSTMEK